MTKLLVQMTKPEDAVAMNTIAADIWSVPYDISSSIETEGLAGKKSAEVFLEVPIEKLSEAISAPLFKMADGLCIPVSCAHIVDNLHLLQSYAPQHKLIACLDIQEASNPNLAALIAASRFQGVWFRSRADSVPFSQKIDITVLGAHIAALRQHSLSVGLSGGLEAPDIVRLLPFMPDWLGFSVEDLSKEDTNGNGKMANLIRALIPQEKHADKANNMLNLGTDRLLVRDFIVPMEIGAYSHEEGRKQRVCFNVIVDVERLSTNPEDMSHIFSYDLIMDGIRQLAELGHVALVETVAERVAAFILAYPQVRHVIVRVEKLDLGAGGVGIEIERSNN